jgi:antitoxin (DNA-binding transcriptional repressor) of toxin-antitoxin stability system
MDRRAHCMHNAGPVACAAPARIGHLHTPPHPGLLRLQSLLPLVRLPFVQMREKEGSPDWHTEILVYNALALYFERIFERTAMYPPRTLEQPILNAAQRFPVLQKSPARRALTKTVSTDKLSSRLSLSVEKGMRQVNIHEAKTNLSKLIERAVNGESFVIAKSGKPMVTVSAYRPPHDPAGRIGFLKGRLEVPEDFDSMGREEIQALFEGAE